MTNISIRKYWKEYRKYFVVQAIITIIGLILLQFFKEFYYEEVRFDDRFLEWLGINVPLLIFFSIFLNGISFLMNWYIDKQNNE